MNHHKVIENGGWGVELFAFRTERKLFSKSCSKKKNKEVQITFTVSIDICSKNKKKLEVQPQ